MNAIMFAEYGRACRYFEDHDSNSGVTSLWVATIAGAYSGFAQSFVASPIEMVKCKLQIQEEVSFHTSSTYIVFFLVEHLYLLAIYIILYTYQILILKIDIISAGFD